jgi:hypothetical protein
MYNPHQVIKFKEEYSVVHKVPERKKALQQTSCTTRGKRLLRQKSEYHTYSPRSKSTSRFGFLSFLGFARNQVNPMH